MWCCVTVVLAVLAAANGTAKLAYDLLLSEGYLEGVVGAETRVCDLVPEESSKIKHKLAPPAAAVAGSTCTPAEMVP